MKKKSWSLMLLMLVLTVVLAACGENKNAGSASASGNTENSGKAQAASAEESDSITVKQKLGDITIKKNPKKVVVFDMGALDTLDKLGVEVTGVPQKTLPAYLKKYADSKYTNVGSLKEADFEKINSIDPDLIIISARLQDSYEELNKIAPTLFVGLDTKDYMNSFTQNVKTLAQIFGKEAEAEQQLTAINDSIKALNDKVKATSKNALVVLTNEGKLSAYGPNSRFGLIHDVFGFAPADSKIEASTHGQNISFEYVMQKNPDYLFVVDRSAVVAGKGEAVPAKQVIENDLVKNTKAFKEGHIVYLDPNYWYLSGGGLESVQEMVKEVDAGVK